MRAWWSRRAQWPGMPDRRRNSTRRHDCRDSLLCALIHRCLLSGRWLAFGSFGSAAMAAEEGPITPKEYAALHGVTPQAVTQWIARGELEAYRDDMGHWHIPRGAARRKSA